MPKTAVEAELGRGTAVHAGGLEHRLEVEVACHGDAVRVHDGHVEIHRSVVDVREQRPRGGAPGHPVVAEKRADLVAVAAGAHHAVAADVVPAPVANVVCAGRRDPSFEEPTTRRGEHPGFTLERDQRVEVSCAERADAGVGWRGEIDGSAVADAVVRVTNPSRA